MNRRLLTLLGAWAAVLLWAAADLAYHYPRLPESIAVHFDAAGAADRWSAKTGFLTSNLLLLLFMSGLFAGLYLLIGHLPARYVNLPRREYWLAPPRSAATRAAVGELVLGLGVVQLATLSALNHVILRSNLRPPPELGAWPWIILGLGLAAMALLLLVGLRPFYRRA